MTAKGQGKSVEKLEKDSPQECDRDNSTGEAALS
jgi:hypothetical protein